MKSLGPLVVVGRWVEREVREEEGVRVLGEGLGEGDGEAERGRVGGGRVSAASERGWVGDDAGGGSVVVL